ncbi:MAG: hypothetical protein GY845_00360 [Planctomycetes bacterium]|nr:hypothetical protein [Planctomycetota bacterium]
MSMVKVLNSEVCKTYSIRSAGKVSLFRDFVLAVFLLVACSVLTAMPAAYGADGYALEFGGTLTINDEQDVLRLSTYTYEFWLKDLEGPTGSWRNIFCKGSGPTNDGRGPLLALRPNEPGLHFSHSTGAGQETANTMEGIPLNEWTHITLVLTDLDGEQIIYQDGVEVVAEGAPGLTDSTQTPVLRIGIGANVALDDFRVWNYARTQGEIEADMNREVTGAEDGLVGYWRFNEGEGTTASDSSPSGNHGTMASPVWTRDAAPIAAPVLASTPTPANGTILADTWVSLSWRAGDGADSQDVYFGENLNDVDEGAGDTFRGNQIATFFIVGFPGFPYPDGLATGKTYYWRIDGVEADGTTKHKGDVWSFTVPPKTAYLPEPADGAQSVDLEPFLKWTGGFGSKLHYVYFGDNFDDVNNAAGGLPQGDATYSPGSLAMAKTYYWRVDEFDIVETYKGNVWSFTTEGAVEALVPANSAVDITQTPVLTWAPGQGATHEVYFGTDPAALELKGSGNLGSESYEPGLLEWNTTYYWRVDEANSANADSPWTGPLWSFSTASFLIIDDFESYNDLDPGDPASNRIFLVWLDGFDNPATNGSIVGHTDPPFAEQTIVHAGLQSMPFVYDNAVGKSEATLTLTSNHDWTIKGINTLTIWYRGDSANAAEPMYVAINDSAVVNHDNPDAAQRASWTEWNIDLQAFADQGANLSIVNTITIGLGNRANPVAGGAGMLYFDDIRLYAQ